MKFVTLPVSELSLSKEKKEEFLGKVIKKDEIDWESLGIAPPEKEEDEEEEYIDLKEEDFKRNYRRVNINFIEEYSDIDLVRGGQKCSLLTYNGITCTVLLSADEIDELLKTKGVDV